MQRRTELAEVIEAQLRPYALAVAHLRDVVLWERAWLSLVVCACMVPTLRIAHSAITSLPLASAICVGLAFTVLAFYLMRAYPGGGQRVISTVLAVLPPPQSRFEDAVSDLAAIATQLEALWDTHVVSWARTSPEPVARAVAATVCLALAFLFSYVATPVVLGVALALLMTVPGAIHNSVPQLILSRIQQQQQFHAKAQ